ncbi:MAG: 2-dehydropantoate 2-reductase [Deltaproteobacteria bacterium]|nr:2-dehydropantoate 2-reductase [Deltaproteobacteria bacterium]
MAKGGSRTSVLVIGAGGVGGYFGAKLCSCDDVDVTFAARGQTLDALKKNGLTLHSPDGDLTVQNVTAAPLKDIDQQFDYVLICVKNYDLTGVIEHLLGVVGEHTAVISLMNGFGADEGISTTVGRSRAFGGVVQVDVHVDDPGVIEHTGGGSITIGELPENQEAAPDPNPAPSSPDGDARLIAFAELCGAAGFPCEVTTDIIQKQWRKLIYNAALNAVTALGRCSVSEAVSVRDGEAVVRAVMIETLMVGQSYGIHLDPSDIETYLAQARKDNSRTSMEVDASRGRRLEFDAINGAVIRKARGIGIPAPVNQTLYSLLKLIDSRAAVKRATA